MASSICPGSFIFPNGCSPGRFSIWLNSSFASAESGRSSRRFSNMTSPSVTGRSPRPMAEGKECQGPRESPDWKVCNLPSRPATNNDMAREYNLSMRYRLRTLLTQFKPRDYLLFAALEIAWWPLFIWSLVADDYEVWKWLVKAWTEF